MLQVNLIGNLGADARIQEHNGTRFLSFNVAHSDRVKDSSGNIVERTQWVSVSLNHYSDKLLPYLVRGAKVFVSGKLFAKIWFDQQRTPNVGLNVLADTLELCGARLEPSPAEGAAASAAVPSPAPAPASPAPANMKTAKKQDDLPF